MMNQSALLRPDWTPATVALMVLGFVVFWPLGLAMLAYILFGEKFQSFKREANRKADTAFAWCRTNNDSASASTGNVAFDDWRKAELERLDEERRRLDEMRAEFDNYARELRRAKDQEEFDRFMRDRQQVKPAGEGGPAQGFTGN
jgi:biopolymer transport protein ExbB/TolQ